MRYRIPRLRPWMWTVLTFSLLAGAAATTNRIWLPWTQSQVSARLASLKASPQQPADGHDDHGHDHGHAGHSEETSIELSQSSLKNIGFRPVTIKLGAFTKTATLPAMVVERPGRSQIQVTAPLTSVITKIVPTQGATIASDTPMFDLYLTHDELVAAQRDFIRTAESLEVVNREIARLKALSEGIIAGKRIIEQEYEKQKLEASLRAERQALLLHGLTKDQVEAILTDRKLFQTLTVKAPAHSDDSESCHVDHPFVVQALPVKLGQQVEAGTVLAVLADHCELYIEGRAFEDDAVRLREAAKKGWNVSASLLVGEKEAETIDGLKLLYLSDSIDPESRVFRFYLSLPNEIVLDQSSSRGQRFIEWRFKPGQRMELRVPVEHWDDRIVLPVKAIVQEGAETYVYQQNGDHFDRVPVHVEYRDQRSAVIANDGSVFPGDVVAASGAYQMHLALKNKAGGGVDPHAGHQH